MSRAGAQPAVAELLDESTLLAIDAAQGSSLRAGGAALLLVQTDGYGADEEITRIGQALSAVCAAAGGTVDYPDEAAAEHYLWLRRSGRGSRSDLWFIGEDVAVPRSALVDMFAAIEQIGRRHGLDAAVVAHAGDGNLHPAFSVPKRPSDGGVPPAALDRRGRVGPHRDCAGGTASGEHGVGITKRPWLVDEIGKSSLHLQRSLKAVFDPRGILNPHTFLATDSSKDDS